MKPLLKRYDMNLYVLKRNRFVSYRNYDKLPHGIEFVTLNYELSEKFKENCFGNCKIWRNTLKFGGVVLALIEGNIVGYGQIKTKKCRDTFYKIGDCTAYLSAFYTSDDYRGQGIYPAVISYLVETNPQYDKFYISAYTTNRSSINGLTKVGFVYKKALSFLRFAKITLNKYPLFSERN